MGGKRSTIEFIREDFKQNNYILKTTVYKNCRQKLEYICPNGHEHSISWTDWQQGNRCPYCYGNGKPTIEFIGIEFDKDGCILLTSEYENCYQKLDYICPNGHHHSISWNNWQQGHRCPYCLSLGKPIIEFIKSLFENEKYILLTTKYESAHQKLEYICPNGHYHNITWNSWKNGARCPYCYGNGKPKIEFIKLDFEKNGWILNSTEYKNNCTKLDCICPNGHNCSISWHNWQHGVRCSKCFNNGISKWEKSVNKFLDKLDINYVSNDKAQLINPNTNWPLELDIWIPQLNKAIECNGVYWHSKENKIRLDMIKQQLCKQQGIDLLVITDEEWNSDEKKCKNKIKKFLRVGEIQE